MEPIFLPPVAVGTFAAKTHWSEMITAVVEKGAEFVITRNKIPVAQLIPYSKPKEPQS